MSILIQWIIVAVVVAAAVVYLVRRLKSKSSCEGCNGNCAGCSKIEKFTSKIP